ncbi:hypothetical protein [Nocardia neocaledoniensis]|uniref:hypothetical protein n=1 Tax=Nocardia neocaledoniensis TaxID=236511 RepID=UPI0024577140|nr:hypothetical protein [Nocardia neocaledoniensis]
MAFARTARKYWVFCVLAAMICGWLIVTGALGLLDDTVTCHTWNIFVLDFSGYDMAPGDTSCSMSKSGGNYADVKFFNNTMDWVKIIIGAVLVWVSCASLNDLAKKENA